MSQKRDWRKLEYLVQSVAMKFSKLCPDELSY